jgi:hypothetical protein
MKWYYLPYKAWQTEVLRILSVYITGNNTAFTASSYRTTQNLKIYAGQRSTHRTEDRRFYLSNVKENTPRLVGLQW